MDVTEIYIIAASALAGGLAGFVFAGMIHSGGDAEAGAAVDRLRERARAAELRARLAEERIAKAYAARDEAHASIRAAVAASDAMKKERNEALRQLKKAQKEIENLRRHKKDLIKTMRRKRKVRNVIPRGQKRLNRREFPDRGNGGKRSKFSRKAFALDEKVVNANGRAHFQR